MERKNRESAQLNLMLQTSYYDNLVKSWHNNAVNQNKQMMYASIIFMLFSSMLILTSGNLNFFLVFSVINFVTAILATVSIYHLNFKVINYIIFDFIEKEYDKRMERIFTILCKIADAIVPASFISGLISLVTFVMWR